MTFEIKALSSFSSKFCLSQDSFSLNLEASLDLCHCYYYILPPAKGGMIHFKKTTLEKQFL